MSTIVLLPHLVAALPLTSSSPPSKTTAKRSLYLACACAPENTKSGHFLYQCHRPSYLACAYITMPTSLLLRATLPIIHWSIMTDPTTLYCLSTPCTPIRISYSSLCLFILFYNIPLDLNMPYNTQFLSDWLRQPHQLPPTFIG